jgi:hypothetical protein
MLAILGCPSVALCTPNTDETAVTVSLVPRRGLATGKRWRTVLGGSPFGVADVRLAEGPAVGGFSGWADEPAAITLRFRVGRRRRLVEVETDRRERIRPTNWMNGAHLLSSARRRRMRYPLVIEKTRLRVKVGGRSRVFRGLAIGDIAAANAVVDGVVVTVRCPEGVPPEGLALARLDEREFENLIRSERERWDVRRRRSRAVKRSHKT